jgi:hypothetical protein
MMPQRSNAKADRRQRRGGTALQQCAGLGLTPRQALSILQLLVCVDLVALDVGQSLLRGEFPRYERDVLVRERQALFRRFIRHSLAIVLLDFELATRMRELREIDAALKIGATTKVVPSRPVFDLDAVAPALDHLVDAVVLRVIERRSRAREGLSAAAWVDAFRTACLLVVPRLILPAVSVDALDRTLRRLRAEAGLPSIRELGTRKSARHLGVARLRAWGFAVRRTTHSTR